MAKKRKAASSPNTRSKEAKEVKEVKEEIEDVPVQTQSSAGATAGQTSAASSGGEVMTARDKLSSVLRVLMDQTDESSETPPTEEDKVEVKVTVKKEKPAGGTTSAAARQAKRNKRRRTLSTDSAFHHTYVMKLFDRSVDLAQFKEDTPLYPICRAWMANQPRNTNLGARKESPSPEPTEDEDQAAAAAEPAEAAAEPTAEGGAAVPIKKVYKLPNPVPLPQDQAERRKYKIPDLIPREKAGEVDMNMEVKPSREALLRDHQAHWVQVRKDWHRTGHLNEARFTQSAKILKDIFKRT